MSGSIYKVTPEQRTEGSYTPGMVREEAISTESIWAGFVRTEAGMTSGWHHHADYETTIFVVSGGAKFEFGPQGGEVLEAAPGDFIRIPPHMIHRESNPGDSESHLVVIRHGSGEAVVNVDGPES